MVDDFKETVGRDDFIEDDLLLRGLKAGFADSDEKFSIASPRRPTMEQIRRHPAIRSLLREGRYTPIGILGHGGMGIVVEVEDAFIGRRVALKVMRRLPESAESAAGPHFLEEARTAAGLDHPGIVPVLDVGLADGRYPWFTMPIVRGRTFAEIVRDLTDDNGRRDAVAIVGRIAEAIAHAHARGVVHGDLKPSNVMVGSLGEVLVMDWGLSRTRGKTAPNGANITVGIGTPGYMAPEQARGATGSIGPRRDVYALGAVLHTIVVGEPPRYTVGAADGTTTDDLIRHAEEKGIAEPLVALIRECLSNSPTDRPADAGRVAERLQSIARAEAEKARSDAFLLVRTRAEAEHHKRRKKWLVGLLVAILIAAGATIRSVVSQSERTVEIERRTRSAVEALNRAVAVDDESVSEPPDRRIESLLVAKSHIVAAERLSEIGEIDAAVADAIVARAQRIIRELETAQRKKADADRRVEFINRISAERARFLEGAKHSDVDRSFAEIFSARGWMPDESNAQSIAAEIKSDPQASYIVETLHVWLLARKGATIQPPNACAGLLRLIVAADPDQKRSDVFRRMTEGDTPAHELEDESMDLLPPSTIHLLADRAARDGHRDRALAIYRRSLIRHPGDYWLRFGLGFRLSEGSTDQELAEAEAAFATCVGLAPESARAHTNLGLVLSRRGQTKRADESLAKALALDPKNRWALFGAGAVALREKRWEKALAYFDECETIGSAEPEWLIVHKCRALVELDRAAEAAAIALEWRKKFPTDVRFLNARLAAFEQLKDESSALAEIDDFLKAAPNTASAYLDLAKIHGRANRRKDMIDALRRALELDDKNSSAAFMLGMNLSNSAIAEFDDLREAERALDRAVSLLPNNGAARKRRGIVRRMLADFAGAVADLEFAAAAAAKDDPAAADTRAILDDTKSDLATRRKIGDVLEGKTLPLTKAEWTDLLTFCATKKIHRTESELWRRALAIVPSPFDDPAGREIFAAARAAIRALSSIGVERRSEPDPSDELRWIEAADRFREASNRLSSSVDSGAIARSAAAEIAGRWCDDPDTKRLDAHFRDGDRKKTEIRGTLARLSALRSANAQDSRPTR